MDVCKNNINERILNLTLEIIYLLTREVYTVVKATSVDCNTPNISSCLPGEMGRNQSLIMVPPPHSLIPEIDNDQKILELTNDIIHLLTGEVPIRCQDVAVYFSMEEWEYIDRHKDLYTEVMVKNQDDETLTSLEESSYSLERCPHPLYSQDSTQEDARTPEENQCEDLTIIKIEDVEEEEMCVTGGQLCMEEGIPTDICQADGCSSGYISRKHLHFPPDCRIEDNAITQDSQGEEFMHPELPNSNILCVPSNEHSSPNNSDIVTHLILNHEIYTDKKPFSCAKCGKGFSWKSDFIIHQRVHTGEKPFSCSECGKRFTQKSSLTVHKRLHTGEKRFSCSECGKRFTQKSDVITHQRVHTGEKPFPCPECGKCFTQRSSVIKHLKNHAGVKPFACSQCGKCFTHNADLVTHQRAHTGEKPFPCPECGKCFTQKSHLITHLGVHTGVKPFSCSNCGKCFTRKSHLSGHMRVHTIEDQFL